MGHDVEENKARNERIQEEVAKADAQAEKFFEESELRQQPELPAHVDGRPDLVIGVVCGHGGEQRLHGVEDRHEPAVACVPRGVYQKCIVLARTGAEALSQAKELERLREILPRRFINTREIMSPQDEGFMKALQRIRKNFCAHCMIRFLQDPPGESTQSFTMCLAIFPIKLPLYPLDEWRVYGTNEMGYVAGLTGCASPCTGSHQPQRNFCRPRVF